MGRRCGFILSLCVCLAALTVSCRGVASGPTPQHRTDRLLEPVPHDRYADDLGRFLAGLPSRAGSTLAGLEQEGVWVRHRDELDQAWTSLDRERLPAIRAFQQSELGSSASASASAPLFYPFSGPDSLTVTALFPNAPVYVMVGLEPAGTLPKPKQLERKNLEKYLAAMRSTLASELGSSFFITRQMDRQFRGQVTDGLFLPILELLVRTGHTVLGFRYVRLDDAGQIIERAPDYHAPGRIGNKGVELEFRTDADASVHKLFYFSVNLSDERLQEDPQFLKFVSTLKGSTTFLKATSYMLHHPEFSLIRRAVLDNSAAVLQDDSGIPYRFYEPPTWRVQLYGEYSRPYGSFRWLEQPDLRNAYLKSAPKPLPFRIGYGYGKVPSNLLLASRTALK
mgnify:CR=1 FL=1